MEESEFVGIFASMATEVLGEAAIVRRGASLFYQLPLNRQLEIAVIDIEKPSQGGCGFQTDLCIFEQMDTVEFPRVVIEFKTGITSHDILTYSAKAGKHKQIYPCLRYGLLASDLTTIPGRFFQHNEHLDFFIAAGQYKAESDVHSLAKTLIEKELETSRVLEQIHFDKRKFDYYRTDVVFRNFGEKTLGDGGDQIRYERFVAQDGEVTLSPSPRKPKTK